MMVCRQLTMSTSRCADVRNGCDRFNVFAVDGRGRFATRTTAHSFQCGNRGYRRRLQWLRFRYDVAVVFTSRRSHNCARPLRFLFVEATVEAAPFDAVNNALRIGWIQIGRCVRIDGGGGSSCVAGHFRHRARLVRIVGHKVE